MRNNTDKLKKLLERCKCGVILIVNEHRDSYQTVEEKLKEFSSLIKPLGIEPEIKQKMIETDTIIDLQFYLDTPIKFYSILHYDLDKALDEALSCLNDNK